MVRRKPRVRTWRRMLRALVPQGRARVPMSSQEPIDAPGQAVPSRAIHDDARRVWPEYAIGLHDLGPHAVGLREDRSPLTVRGKPRQGRLGDCWVIAPMLAIQGAAPERLAALFTDEAEGTVSVRLPGARRAVRVNRTFPVDASGHFIYARLDGGAPGWVGVLEKAIAEYVAGGYGFLQRGFGRYGLQLLLGMRVRTLLALPSAEQVVQWRGESRAVVASTHPLSRFVRTAQGPLAPNHVYVVVGAEPASGHILLRNPTRPRVVLRIDARSFRRGFLSVDVTAPLKVA